MLLSKLKEKNQTFVTGADATLDLCALGEKQVICIGSSSSKKRMIEFQNKLGKRLLSKS